MTIIDAINRAAQIRPNVRPQAEKIQWLSELDHKIKTEIIDVREGAELISFTPYTEDTPLNTELLIPAPYDVVYIDYLVMKLDLANNETARYQNSSALYNTNLHSFIKYWYRTHKTARRKNFKWI
jgi:hypothetical protein